MILKEISLEYKKHWTAETTPNFKITDKEAKKEEEKKVKRQEEITKDFGLAHHHHLQSDYAQ